MPIFAYRCLQCGVDSEYIQKFSDPPMTGCEACGGTMTLVATSGALQLKGEGWYKDGYRNTKRDSDKKFATDKPTDIEDATDLDLAKSMELFAVRELGRIRTFSDPPTDLLAKWQELQQYASAEITRGPQLAGAP